MRVLVLEFLETDIFNLSVEHCVTFLDPLIESWDIDLATFGMEIVLNRRLAPGHLKTFGFVELKPAAPVDDEPRLQAFLQDPSLRGDATAEEIEFLRKLKFMRQRRLSTITANCKTCETRSISAARRKRKRGPLSVDVD
jgi:hypothetical protein